jgi:hypothetical protein
MKSRSGWSSFTKPTRNRGRDDVNVSYPNFTDWRTQSQSFEQLAACLYGGMILTGKSA